MHPCDAELVLRTQLTSHEVQDERVWVHTKDGGFTVKSAYHAAIQKELAKEGEVRGSNDQGVRGFWRKVWKLQAIPRVKMMIWRAARDILPCKMRLQERKVLE